MFLGGLEKVAALKQINPNLKALFSLGGYAAGTQLFTAVSSDATKRATMAQSAIEFCQTYNFDGLDVDWEYPLEGDRVNKFLATLIFFKSFCCLRKTTSPCCQI